MTKIDYLLKYKEIMKMLREAAQCRQFDERNGKNDEVIGKYYQGSVLVKGFFGRKCLRFKDLLFRILDAVVGYKKLF